MSAETDMREELVSETVIAEGTEPVAASAQNTESEKIMRAVNREEQTKTLSRTSRTQSPDPYQIEAEILRKHGINVDQLKGMEEYSNNGFRGMALVMYAITGALILAAGIVCGPASKICICALLALATEGCLLSQESRRRYVLRIPCRVLFMLPFPMCLALFICQVAGAVNLAVDILVLIYEVICLVFIIFGTVCFFIVDPYHTDRRRVKAARAEMKAMNKELRHPKQQMERKTKMRDRLRKLEKLEAKAREKAEGKILRAKKRKK